MSQNNHRPRKRFGQNFLHDKTVIQRIVKYINPQPNDLLVEIGPGLGALTDALIERTHPIHAIEIDNDLAAHLTQRYTPQQLILHHSDALTFDFRSLIHGEQKIRLIGNLPYNISTPLLFHVLEQIECIQDMSFMLQKEVVQRLAAVPGTKNYGRLTVMVQYWCRVEKWFEVGSGAFTPAPKIDSAVVHLTPHETPLVSVKDTTDFHQIVKSAFGQRRKTLANGLKGLLTKDEISFLGIDPGKRAETLDIYAFAALSNAITQKKFTAMTNTP
ncbi:MAG: 16S rRNA (adenine(1518)-N(6)/adenine(1519)-N(6))-dimethyltransferase RsmA [Gammaproteobacteria bacterium]|nr:16S rRNA (adenine(1518)-N(6)/adenine(1519)-N(6))-dimethyltransferase RsmA [Gammaproteobacteria bacterium]